MNHNEIKKMYLKKYQNVSNIKINILQLIKFGMHFGNDFSETKISNYSYIIGKKYGNTLINLNYTLINLRKIIFLHKKILAKKGLIVISNNIDDKNFHQLKKFFSINLKNFLTTNKKFVGGIISNKEIFYKKTFVNKFRLGFIKRNIKKNGLFNKNFFIKRLKNSSNIYKFPSIYLLLGLTQNKYHILESRKKNINTVVISDTNDNLNSANYHLLINCKSTNSLNYFFKAINFIALKK